jgi:hypothetical protein
VTLFTIQLELGPETRKMVERVATKALVQLEVGPKTREFVRSLAPGDEGDGDGVQSLLRKGVKAARGD